jgi:hypothetical protein
MKMCVGVKVELYMFLPTALEGGKTTASRHGRSTPGVGG